MASGIVRPSICLSVTSVDCDHMGLNSSNIISQLVSRCLLSAGQTPIKLNK